MRSLIYHLISRIKPLDLIEEQQIAFAKEWIDSGAELFRIAKPDRPDTHLVTYFVLLDQKSNKILLVDHKKAELWLPPGGHVEKDEHPKQAAEREAKEELGIKAHFLYEDPFFITVTKTLGTITPHTDVSFWYLLKGNPQDHLKYEEEEFHQIQWFELSKIPFERTDPNMRRFIKKLRGSQWLANTLSSEQ
jgi:8-oxo-dGTP diphosphatase